MSCSGTGRPTSSGRAVPLGSGPYRVDSSPYAALAASCHQPHESREWEKTRTVLPALSFSNFTPPNSIPKTHIDERTFSPLDLPQPTIPRARGAATF